MRGLVLVIAAGCTTGAEGTVPPDAQIAIDSPIVPEDPGIAWYSARLATTPSVPFGGPPYCNYSVRLSDVRLDVMMNATDGLSSMLVADTMNEATVGMCSFAPAPSSRQGFAYLGVPRPADPDGAFTPMLQGLPANAPKTALAVSITRGSAEALSATVSWSRTDQTAPLEWTVATQSPIALTRRTCEIGKTYCLGDSNQGLLYSCVDGSHLTRIKVCSPGCIAADPPRTPHVDEQCN